MNAHAVQADAVAGDRLWYDLSHPFVREPPPEGWDLAAARLRARVTRRRAGRSLRRRAEAILAMRAEFHDARESELNDAIWQVRLAVRTGARDRPTVDRAYALACEAVRREVGLLLHPEQVMGALVLLGRSVAEMATGEGKTVTAILPASLLAWEGRGVHVVTVNDYLARRDAEITGPAYARLGVSVGVLQSDTPHADRRAAYACGVTYAADKEVIFDFLRDRLNGPLNPRLVPHLLDQITDVPSWGARRVQRGLYAAIIDEADNVLIDEAITPAIIGQEEPAVDHQHAAYYRTARDIAQDLVHGRDYRVDHRMRTVRLTEEGRRRIAGKADALPPFWSGPRRREELVTLALTARELYRRGEEYIVRGDEIVIVDHGTGRLLEGRKWQMGLHQAVQAKEGLPVTEDRTTTARVSYQRFFQRYRRLSGMTGTAWEVAEELWTYYRLSVVRIPTHRPVIRRQLPDRVLPTEAEKFQAVAEEVARYHAVGRPVLIGTRSVAASERLGSLLAERGVPVRILNAVREAEEAEIIAHAGQAGAVTVATNMAGRGTDIRLDERARELGGLVVIATERHGERRVDRQLFGRSGRQGDPGLARAFLSLEDPLIREHGLWPLLWLTRVLRGPARPLAARALWWAAQVSASARASAARRRNASVDAWIDLALHEHYR